MKRKLVLKAETLRVLATREVSNVPGAQAASPAWCATMRDVDTCGANCIPTGSVW